MIMDRWVFGVLAPTEQFLGRLWALIPFSVAEVLTAAVLVSAAAWLFRALFKLVRERSVGAFLRRLLILGGAEDLLDPAVLAMIRERGLYGTDRCRKGLSFADLKRESLLLHKENRVKHVIGCSETSRELALIHGADPVAAERAGILHDVTKALDGEDQLRLCDKYGIVISDFDRAHTKLLHSVTGAEVAERVFGENDAVVQAIRWHTSGKADMTTLEKIIYIADYVERNRSFPGVEEMRRLAYTDLDAAVLMGLESAVAHVKRQGQELAPATLEALEFLRNQA
jgi:nicotinate-nucleotide adenylyltransferase